MVTSGVIEPAGPCHAAAMAAVHAAAFPLAERWDQASIGTQLGLPGVFGAVHGAGGMILTRVIAGEAEVLTIAVAPPARRRGVGRALLADAMAAAQRQGAAAMFLEVAENNEGARALYAAAGFHPVGRRKGYYPGKVDALLLRAELRPCAGPGR